MRGHKHCLLLEQSAVVNYFFFHHQRHIRRHGMAVSDSNGETASAVEADRTDNLTRGRNESNKLLDRDWTYDKNELNMPASKLISPYKEKPL